MVGGGGGVITGIVPVYRKYHRLCRILRLYIWEWKMSPLSLSFFRECVFSLWGLHWIPFNFLKEPPQVVLFVEQWENNSIKNNLTPHLITDVNVPPPPGFSRPICVSVVSGRLVHTFVWILKWENQTQRESAAINNGDGWITTSDLFGGNRFQ